MKNILFCGSYIPEEVCEEVKHNSQAANNFQSLILRELKKRNNLDVLTYIGYPLDNAQILVKSLRQHGINYIVKKLCANIIFAVLKYNKLLKKLIKGKQIVILYNYNYVNLSVNYFCHRKGVKTLLIVADHTEPHEYKNWVRRALAQKYARDYDKFDHLIFLSEFLMEKYKHKKPVLLEGGIDIKRYENYTPVAESSKFIILFSGVLTNVTGVDIYIEAIKKIKDENINFLFSGKGELEDYLKDYAEKDHRIKYLGFLSDKEYLEHLSKAHILINPRNMHLPQNQNNFPSKVLEYLASGRVIISTRFPGFERFTENMTFCEADPQSIAEAVENAVHNYSFTYKMQYDINRKKAIAYDWETQINKIEALI